MATDTKIKPDAPTAEKEVEVIDLADKVPVEQYELRPATPEAVQEVAEEATITADHTIESSVLQVQAAADVHLFKEPAYSKEAAYSDSLVSEFKNVAGEEKQKFETSLMGLVGGNTGAEKSVDAFAIPLAPETSIPLAELPTEAEKSPEIPVARVATAEEIANAGLDTPTTAETLTPAEELANMAPAQNEDPAEVLAESVPTETQTADEALASMMGGVTEEGVPADIEQAIVNNFQTRREQHTQNKINEERQQNGGRTKAEIAQTLNEMTGDASREVGMSQPDVSGATEAIAHAATEFAADKAAKEKPSVPVKNLYEKLRGISFLSGIADKLEVGNATKKIDKLELALLDNKAEIEANVKRMMESGMSRDVAERIPIIAKLKEQGQKLVDEKTKYETKRDSAAGNISIETGKKVQRINGRLEQISGGIKAFQLEIEGLNTTISKIEAETEADKDILSGAAIRDSKLAVMHLKLSIEGVKRKIGHLAIERNSLRISVGEIDKTVSAMDSVKSENKPITAEEPLDYKSERIPGASVIIDGERAPVEAEATQEVSSESLENSASPEKQEGKETLANFIDTWNDTAKGYNRVNLRKGEPLLPKLQADGPLFESALEAVQKQMPDVTAETMSPEAFKLFIQKYAEIDPEQKLDMTKAGQEDFIDALKETTESLDIKEVDPEVYKVNTEKAAIAEEEIKAAQQIKNPAKSTVKIANASRPATSTAKEPVKPIPLAGEPNTDGPIPIPLAGEPTSDDSSVYNIAPKVAPKKAA